MRELSRADRALRASARRGVPRAPRTYTGRSTSERSAVFLARYSGYCGRCGFEIRVHQDVRFHRDFDGVIHDGCRAPAVTIRTTGVTTGRRTRTTGAGVYRQPEFCPECHLEHAGECW